MIVAGKWSACTVKSTPRSQLTMFGKTIYTKNFVDECNKASESVVIRSLHRGQSIRSALSFDMWIFQLLGTELQSR
jgi:hypothetical protein